MTFSRVSGTPSNRALSTTPWPYDSLLLLARYQSKRMGIQGLKSSHTPSNGSALRPPSCRLGSCSVRTRGETATYCRYSGKEIESVGILGLAKQFGNRPHMSRNSSFRGGRYSQTTKQSAASAALCQSDHNLTTFAPLHMASLLPHW